VEARKRIQIIVAVRREHIERAELYLFIVLAGMQRVEVGDAVDADDHGRSSRMGAHARVALRAELLTARIRIDLELAAQASFRAVFISDMGPGSR